MSIKDKVQFLKNNSNNSGDFQINVPIFLLDQIKNLKHYISLHASFLRECEQGRFKLYAPSIFQNRIEVPFRKGEYLFLGTRITRSLYDLDKDQL